ncbi:MFS transporter [Kutzneria kofuensis]|uniref:Putative MFS transporter n=1 Tax=Kutzneria kofuensis TaxID=103725 RepID=A0A7W9KPC8_9PSEU|nr:MFS transporter [Kutzneria kofuensis]MBB5896261.1 putative MFS transporter [Kutzneria kofuensis]
MTNIEPGRARRTANFHHPVAFWLGAAACTAGVLLHLPMYLGARDMGYRLVGMEMDASMLTGMGLILAGLALALYGLVPRGAGSIGRRASGIRVRALDDAPVRFQHVALLVVMALAVTIDVMKPTTLAFVAPGVAAEYGLKTAANPHGTLPVSWLPLVGITGTLLGSLLWGWGGDRIGRRASIVFAALLFVSTSICGAMPSFQWNLAMCFLMGTGAGGMLPIAFALIAETMPARHRGWLIVLIGGDVAGAYVITSWLAGALTPEYSWRILWLLGLPTGLLLLLLNRWIPESARFLLATGQDEAAAQVMRRYGARVVTAADSAGPTGPQPSGRGSYASLFARPFAGPTTAVVALAVAIGLLTYGFQFWVPTNLQHLGLTAVTSDYVLRDSALIGLPVTVLVALLYGFWNSRWTVILLSALTAVSVLVFALFADTVVHNQFLLSVLLVIPLTGISSATAAVTAYSAEIYPTRVRSRGAGLTAGMTKAGGVAVLALAVAAIAAPSILLTALLGAIPLLLAVVVFALTAPDTHQRQLEEIVGERSAV